MSGHNRGLLPPLRSFYPWQMSTSTFPLDWDTMWADPPGPGQPSYTCSIYTSAQGRSCLAHLLLVA